MNSEAKQPSPSVSSVSYTALYVELILLVLWLAEIKSCSQNSGHWYNAGSARVIIEIVMSKDDTFKCQ